MSEPRRIVIGMTGASGVAYGIRELEVLATESDVEPHLVLPAAARWVPRQAEQSARHGPFAVRAYVQRPVGVDMHIRSVADIREILGQSGPCVDYL